MAFEGYYIKFGGTPFPDVMIDESYQCKANERIVIGSFVDANRTEHKDVSDKTKSTIVLKTKDYLTNDEKNAIINCMNMGLVNEVEDKYTVTFYNPRKDSYEKITAFVEMSEFKVIKELDSGPVYSSIEITIIQNVG